MLEEAIFAHIIADSTLATKLSAGSGKYHIYPVRAPDGVAPSKMLVYTEISQSLTYPLVRASRFQISCIASTYEDARGMAADIDRIFNDYNEVLLGGTFAVKYIKFEGRTSLFDEDAKLYVFPVELFIKF
jgi:hypothetical protein